MLDARAAPKHRGDGHRNQEAREAGAVVRVSRSRRTLDALLTEARLPDAVSVETLSIGWPGRGGGGYRDDDGTHARVWLIDGRSVVYREYATTSRAASRYRMKESFVLGQLGHAGLPTPTILAVTDGIEAGAPPAMLYSDPGGTPLEAHTSGSLATEDQEALWAEVGRRLRQLHDVDSALVGPLAEPANDRPWMQSVTYFAKSLRTFKKKHPSSAEQVDDLLAILRGPVAAHVAGRRRSICCGHYALPGLMLDPRDWQTKSWLSLGY